MDEKIRKSTITKTITRNFFPFPDHTYKRVEVSVTSQEEVEWTTLEERAKKTANISKVLMKDFEETVSHFFEEMKLDKEQKNAKVVAAVPKKTANPLDELGD